MKKRILALFTAVCALTLLTGCTFETNKSYVFDVETGDRIEVKLNTTKGYDLSSDNPFEVSCDEELLTLGIFMYAEDYESYEAVVEEDEDAELLDSGSKDGNEYIFWSYMDEEYNYAILVEDSDTMIILTNGVSEKSAEECFERLELSVYEED